MGDGGVGDRIRLARKQLGFTQAEFGKTIGRTKLSVIRYEAGTIPRADVLDQIARVTGVTVTWLLRGSDERRTNARRSATDVKREISTPALRSDVLAKNALASLPALPPKYLRRYQERVEELTRRFRRDLMEYRKALEAECRLEALLSGAKQKAKRR